MAPASVIAAHVGSLSVAGAPVEFIHAEAVRVGESSSPEFRFLAAELSRLDPTSPALVEVAPNGDTGPGAWLPADALVDPLFGRIYFNATPGPAALVRVSGYALPALQVGLVREVSLSVTNDAVELQVLGDGYKRRAVTLRDFSGEFSGLTLPAQVLSDAMRSGAPMLIEAGKGPGGEVLRAWVKVPELSHKLTPGALYEHTVKFVGLPFPLEGGGVVAWGYGSP
ncbi:hypothetical protein DRW03_34620 [Corallococcus sp. H22C18031201]|nr:hypothetical protein DRW03_34620 [Corallococcus sp. H22C18031201]